MPAAKLVRVPTCHKENPEMELDGLNINNINQCQ